MFLSIIPTHPIWKDWKSWSEETPKIVFRLSKNPTPIKKYWRRILECLSYPIPDSLQVFGSGKDTGID